MAYNFPIPIGTDPWGALVNDSMFDLHRMVETNAADHTAVAWTFDPAANSGSTIIATGTPFMSKVWVREPMTLSTLYASITTSGATLTAGQNFAGVYNAAGTRIALTADQTTPWGTTTGLQTMALTVPVAVTPGAYYLTLLSNGTTAPNFARGAVAGSGASTINWRLTATDARYATGPAAQTSLPASITMASRTTSAVSMWMAVA
jgi:hypothetical protein